ncbi:MAG: hypothetical protein V2A73_05275 [Pseudomonadota bacterium]
MRKTNAFAKGLSLILSASVAASGCMTGVIGQEQDESESAPNDDSAGSPIESEYSAPDVASLSSAITYDRFGRAYQSTFELVAQQMLTKRASDVAGFYRLLEQAFGSDFDRDTAEVIRKEILLRDFTWAPPVQLVAPGSIPALAAYAPSTGVIYLDESVPSTALRVLVYLEEVGHHLDTLLSAEDTPGDEGALFRMFLTSTQVSSEVVEAMRLNEDRGEIIVNGRIVEVEFLFGWLKKALGWAWGGIKTGGKWVWSGAKTAGSAIKTASSKTWDGAKVLGGWIKEGADKAADKFVEVLKREFWGAFTVMQSAVNGLVALGFGVYDGVRAMGEGLAEIAKGNFKDGTALFFVGLAKLAVEAPLDAILTTAADSIAGLQTMLYLEPVGRYYNSTEKAEVSKVFGKGGGWAGMVRIKEGFCGLWSLNDRPFTLETTIYLKKWPHSLTTVIHESTHVWQWINGGGDYKIHSVSEQYFGDGYEWQSKVDSGTSWADLGTEPQAEFVEDAYNTGRCFDNPTKPCQINAKNRTAFFLAVYDALRNGDGAP